MQLTLLGTGCPSVDFNRYGPANLIHTTKARILIDCGSGVTQRLKKTKISLAKIDALFLTHLHSDHVIDLYQLIISSWHLYRDKTWKIYGPKGTKKFVQSIMKSWKDERELRIRYEKRYSIKAFDLKVYEFSKYGKIKIKDLIVGYFVFDHYPVKP
jgi:ribonuclease Z